MLMSSSTSHPCSSGREVTTDTAAAVVVVVVADVGCVVPSPRHRPTGRSLSSSRLRHCPETGSLVSSFTELKDRSKPGIVRGHKSRRFCSSCCLCVAGRRCRQVTTPQQSTNRPFLFSSSFFERRGTYGKAVRYQYYYDDRLASVIRVRDIEQRVLHTRLSLILL